MRIQNLLISLLIFASSCRTISSFYAHYFGKERDVRVLPFVFSERFKKVQAFAGRNGACVALGSLSHTHGDVPRYAAFHKFFKTSYLAPFRKTLYDEKVRLAGLIDVMIMDPYKGNSRSSNILLRFASRFQSLWSSYYSFDVVSILNQYKMFLVPEEAAGPCAALFVEGMACGCAYVGDVNRPMYRDFGMIEGVHYIGYDASLEDLVEKVNFYIQNTDILEKIANSGHELAIRKFSRATNYQKFIELF
jgi:glycosyltransferase involved in cell wall biosynthesis